MPEQRDRGCLSPICPLGPPVDVVVARIGGKNTPERWRIVAGRSRIPSLREVFWLTLPTGEAYLISAADLPHLDVADGQADGKIYIFNIVRTRR